MDSSRTPPWIDYLFIFLITFSLTFLLVSLMRVNYITYDERWFIQTEKLIVKNTKLKIEKPLLLNYPPLTMMVQSVPFFFAPKEIAKKVNRFDHLRPYPYFLHHTSLPQSVFYKNNQYIYKIRDSALWFRAALILFWLILIGIVYHWSKNLYGSSAALLALFLLILQPSLLGHGSLARSDFGSMTLMSLSLYCFYRFLIKSTWPSLIIAGFTLGLALSSKFPALELLLIFFILTFIWSFKANFKNIGTLLGSYILIVAFGFMTIGFIYNLINAHPADAPFSMFIPYNYIEGLSNRIYNFRYGEPIETNFFFGQFYSSGPWYYFLVLLLIKTPLALIILLILRAFSLRKQINQFEELALLIPILTHLILLCFFNNINNGIRHMLFIYPLLIIWVSQLMNAQLSRLYAITIALLLAWHTMGTVLTYPHYLSYFNEILGTKNTYKHLVDSNVDLGQDEILVHEFVLDQKIKDQKININPMEPCTGLIIVNIKLLRGYWLENRESFKWLKNEKPIGQIGHSWLIYKISNKLKAS
jgi:4-amino-4-deoxy-L-arabinose transferase-like glycosyltransferase